MKWLKKKLVSSVVLREGIDVGVQIGIREERARILALFRREFGSHKYIRISVEDLSELISRKNS